MSARADGRWRVARARSRSARARRRQPAHQRRDEQHEQQAQQRDRSGARGDQPPGDSRLDEDRHARQPLTAVTIQRRPVSRTASGMRYRRRPSSTTATTSTSRTAGRRLGTHRDQLRTSPGDARRHSRRRRLQLTQQRGRCRSNPSRLSAAVAVRQIALEERASRGGRRARVAGRDGGRVPGFAFVSRSAGRRRRGRRRRRCRWGRPARVGGPA